MIARIACLLLVGAALACGRHTEDDGVAIALAGGDPAHGAELVQRYGCGSCHTIPDVPGAVANVGPSLEHVASRTYLAGSLQNRPENMMKWIEHPQSVTGNANAMPEMGIPDGDARDIATFLYTLR